MVSWPTMAFANMDLSTVGWTKSGQFLNKLSFATVE